MSTEWQIPGFSQEQMNDLRYFLEDTISTAIEIAFVEQTRIFERTINETINVCLNFLFAHFAFSLPASRDWIIHEQEQFAIESISVLERLALSIKLNGFAYLSASARSVISFSNSRLAVISFFRWFRFVIKRALVALLTAYDVFLLSRRSVSQQLIFFWRVAPLYRDLMKKELD